MTLPKHAEKGYLEVGHAGGRPLIRGQKKHLDELAPLFAQNGMPCRREAAEAEDEETLLFEQAIDEAKVKELLEAYKNAKRS